MNVNQRLKLRFRMSRLVVIFYGSFLVISIANSQQVEEVRWKSESQVRELYGEPNTVHGPVGTHASYMLWKYDDYTIAFANNRAFHLFKKDSLTKLQLEEER